ncbi:MAG: hypothetical protein RL299_1893 [Pseudomonadota bacterium]|jgi:hypothetical protein
MVEKKSRKDRAMYGAKMAFDPVTAALQQLHHAVASEDVPEEFLRILDEIDAGIAAAKPSTPK